MNFTEATLKNESSIVAVVQKFHTQEQPFPEIWGTGFFVSEHGVVATAGPRLRHRRDIGGQHRGAPRRERPIP